MKDCFALVGNKPGWLSLLLVVFSTIGPTGPERCLADDKPASSSLEEYFKKLGYEAVGFEGTGNMQPFVEGAMGNGRKRKFLVDTGWGMTALNESSARGLKKLDELDGVLQDNAFATMTNAGFVLIDNLALGRAQFLNQPARVEKFRFEYIQVPFDGVLGYDFLLRNFCLIDCWKRQLYVRRAKPSEEESKVMEETLRLSGFAEVPLTVKHLLVVEPEINGQSVCLAVDTGAPYDELDDSEIKALGLTIVKNDRPLTGSMIQSAVSGGVIGMGDVGKHKLQVAKLQTFQMGPRKWKNIDFGVTDLKAWDLAKPGTHGEAVKGLLSQSGVVMRGAIIDVSGCKLWLRPQKAASH